MNYYTMKKNWLKQINGLMKENKRLHMQVERLARRSDGLERKLADMRTEIDAIERLAEEALAKLTKKEGVK